MRTLRPTWTKVVVVAAIDPRHFRRDPVCDPNYTLESNYTDHLQHEYSSWAFLHIGFRIFALPKADWAPVHAKHVHLLWDSLPTIYPLDLVLFFMPFGIVSNEGWMSDAHVTAWMVMVLGLAGVLASVQLGRYQASDRMPLAVTHGVSVVQFVALIAGLLVVGITYVTTVSWLLHVSRSPLRSFFLSINGSRGTRFS